MFSAEDLLHPIQPDAPAGRDLRYDPVYDQIAEARSEEDATLPVGQWARQTKKADYQAVASLAQEALTKRSKDLWLGAWLGEARIKLDGVHALASSLHLLLGLQERFWDSLHPEVEDGDAGMRAAPLQWALERYAALVYELPVVADAVSYYDYKAVRAPHAGAAAAQSAVEALDAALQKTDKAFYAAAESSVSSAREVLEKLYLFCDEAYRDDGPSFVKIRTALEEVYNLVASLLRAKREADPDPVEPAPAVDEQSAQTPEPQEAVLAPTPEPKTVQVEEVAKPQAEATSEARQAEIVIPPQSWDEAAELIRRNALYLAKEKPASPVAYLLLCAFHQEATRTDRQPPATELRVALKKASRENNGQAQLEASLQALALPCADGWLDIHRYIWAASRACGYQAIAESVLDVTRVMLRQCSSLADAMFDDDTPLASPETKQWIEIEVLQTEKAAPEPEEIATPPAPPVAMQIEESARAGDEIDIDAEAEAMAADGNLMGSIQLLMQDAALSQVRRVHFQRRLKAAQLCLARGQKAMAHRLLEDLLAEVEEYGLETWEGPQVVGEVLALLVQSLDEEEGSKERRQTLMTRLCRLDPVKALSLEARA